MNASPHPEKPSYPKFVGLPRIPVMSTLQQRHQWVAWDYRWRPNPASESGGSWTKPPINPQTGQNASHSDAATWGSYDNAVARAQRDDLPGVGYVLTDDDDVVGIDLDHCRDKSTGELEAWTADLLSLAETYAERSPSDEGIRILALGKIEQTIKFDPAGIEIYRDRRFLTLTGRHINGSPVQLLPAPRTIAALLSRIDSVKAENRNEGTATAPPSENAQRQSSTRGPISEAFGDGFFRKVNGAALANLGAWVSALFGRAAVYQPGTGGYRVSSASLGRDLQEDLSITPQGIKDWGVWDIGDDRKGKRSAIDVVMEYGGKSSAADAALWLCQKLGIEPASLGWRTTGTGRDQPCADHDGADGAQQDDRGRGHSNLPIIRIVAGELPAVVDQAEEAIVSSERPVFVRAGELVRPIVDALPAAKGRMTAIGKLKAFCTDSLLDLLGQIAVYERYDARRKDWVRVDPTAKIASVLLAREGAWQLPSVAGVITTPTLRPDGSLLSAPGYDPATRLYLAADAGLTLPPIPESPTKIEAGNALRLILDLLSSFPFVSAVDRSVALSGIVTAIVRGALSIAPLHAIRAHTPGTGKSHLVDVAATIATGRPCPVIAAGKTEEETEKRLGALLSDAVPVVSLDNVNGELGGDILCQITERPLVRVRILGRSEAPEFESRATIFATGNNLTLVGDMVRRTLLCSLDAGVERPELREFDFDPVQRVLDNRSAYVAAAIIIARAYRAAGSPAVCHAIGSYGEWSTMVRAPLIWLGEADPVDSMETARDEDPELTSIRELFGHWRDQLVENNSYTTNRIIQIACERNMGTNEFRLSEFRDLLLRIAGDGGAVNSRRLGRWLSRISGRVVDGRRLITLPDRSHGNRFSLTQESNQSARPDGGFEGFEG
jgi:hypothetical protein